MTPTPDGIRGQSIMSFPAAAYAEVCSSNGVSRFMLTGSVFARIRSARRLDTLYLPTTMSLRVVGAGGAPSWRFSLPVEVGPLLSSHRRYSVLRRGVQVLRRGDKLLQSRRMLSPRLPALPHAVASRWSPTRCFPKGVAGEPPYKSLRHAAGGRFAAQRGRHRRLRQ